MAKVGQPPAEPRPTGSSSTSKVEKGKSDSRKGSRSKQPGSRPDGKRTRDAKKKRIKRPAEATSLTAAVAGILVSILGFEGPQAKEMTAALIGVLGVIPIGVSKLVDWKRERDVFEAERLDLMERAVVALEHSVDEGTSQETVETTAATLGITTNS